MEKCPLCGGRDVGKIGRDRYYCGECCHEWTGERNSVRVYKIMQDGSITRLRTEAELLLMQELHANRWVG